MKLLYTIFYWVTESTARTFTGLIVISTLSLTGIHFVQAATSYDVTNEPQMNLDVSINGTQTTGIILSAPQLNATNHTFATTTGGILRIRFGAYKEDIYFSSATVNATTYKVTLAGVIRNICPQVARSYVTCGAGRSWGKGAIVELNTDARLFNLKANIDRANTFTASGALAFSGSGSLSFPTFATTAARNQALGTNPSGPVRGACVTATGLCYVYTGGVWTSLATDGTANATTTAAGKSELATAADLLAGTLTGDSGGPIVLSTSVTTRTSTGTTQANKIPALGTSGYLTGSLLGSGTTNSGTTLYGDNVWRAPQSSFYFGNGSDGAVSIGTGTTVSLSGDKNYTNLTVYSGATLNPNGYRIYVSGILKMVDPGVSPAARIASNGGNGGNGGNGASACSGAGGTAGSAGTIANAAGTMPGSIVGIVGGVGGAANACIAVAGGNAGNAVSGTAESISMLGNGVAGGEGGAGGAGGGGGSAGAGGTSTAGVGTITNANLFFNASISFFSWPTARTFNGRAGSASGAGGGAGGSGNPATGNPGAGGGGGGSGANGGNFDLYAATLTGSGYIMANGGTGGIGGNGGNATVNGAPGGGGGGGGGGNGGTISAFYKVNTSWTGKFEARGSAGGAAGTKGTGGSGTPVDGSVGTLGLDGQVFQFQVR